MLPMTPDRTGCRGGILMPLAAKQFSANRSQLSLNNPLETDHA
jgi:hypothetical protein